MRSTTAGTTLGAFVLEMARGTEKKHVFDPSRAQEVRDQLSERINTRVEEIRTQQRRAFEEGKPVTIF